MLALGILLLLGFVIWCCAQTARAQAVRDKLITCPECGTRGRTTTRRVGRRRTRLHCRECGVRRLV